MTENQKSKALEMYPKIKNGTLSRGKATEILGVNKLDLIDFYDDCGYPYFDTSPEEAQKDVKTIEHMLSQGGKHNE